MDKESLVVEHVQQVMLTQKRWNFNSKKKRSSYHGKKVEVFYFMHTLTIRPHIKSNSFLKQVLIY